MVTETTNALAPLLPNRHPQHDLFICDVADAVLKDVMQHMEHPFYALSKKPETGVRRYEHNERWIEITPSVKGLATIYDKDILIYCISQIMAKLKKKGQIRAHGVSCHSLAALQACVNEPWVDSVHARINAYGASMDGPPEKVAPVLKALHEAGKGIVGMKLIGEGRFRDSDEKRDESVRYVLGLGCVDAMV
ncbi:MAG: aldo/keto reductase, partial [Chromatiaceae bacterium]